jgi:hypothetical protein
MGVRLNHLKRPEPEQLCDGAQNHSSHYESTGKRVAVAMPGISLDFILFQHRRKPATLNGAQDGTVAFAMHVLL